MYPDLHIPHRTNQAFLFLPRSERAATQIKPHHPQWNTIPSYGYQSETRNQENIVCENSFTLESLFFTYSSFHEQFARECLPWCSAIVNISTNLLSEAGEKMWRCPVNNTRMSNFERLSKSLCSVLLLKLVSLDASGVLLQTQDYKIIYPLLGQGSYYLNSSR